jgi:hypothetical protein
MATVMAVSARTQSMTAMKKVLNYVMQPKKTDYMNPETGISYQLLSGQNCMPETAYTEFMNTKEQYKKAHGVFFKHYVQSFKPDCGATPDEIHQIGVEFAKQFEGFEVVVATHIDADHWHNHFVVNSVNFETGLKIQINEKGLERLRNRSDEICRRFGLEVLEPYQKPNQRSMNQREYRAALRGNSWKVKLISAIEKAMASSDSKTAFIRNMEQMNYGVKWIDHYKYITYTAPDGQKCRDNRLFDEKYLKANMEEYFNELGQANGIKRGNKRDTDRAVSAGVDWSKTGAVERFNQAHNDSRAKTNREYGTHIQPADTRLSGLSADGRNQGAYLTDGETYWLRDEVADGITAGNDYGEYFGDVEFHPEDDYQWESGYDGQTQGAGFIPGKAENQVGFDWGGLAHDTLAMAAHFESLMAPPPKKKKKASPENKKKRNKRDSLGRDSIEHEMTM